MTWILAIAVGPERTWVARHEMTGKAAAPRFVPLESGEPGPMPSAVWTDGQQVLVGSAATDRGAQLPAGLITDPYLLLSRASDPASTTGPSTPSADPRDLVGALLEQAYARGIADQAAPPDADPNAPDNAQPERKASAPERVLVTHPDSWSGEEVLALRSAASRAGLGIDPVPEAVALASAYRAAGGEGTRLLVVDAVRRQAAAVARMGKVFVVLATATERRLPDRPGASPVERLVAVAEDVLTQPGVRRDRLNELVLTGAPVDSELGSALTAVLNRPPVELPHDALAAGALSYDAALHEARPQPVLPTPAPPQPSPAPPAPRINHAAPVRGSRRLPIVPLLILILAVLVAAELLFVYWPF